MAWTAPKTWTDGSVLTAAELNQQLRDNLTFLKTPPTDTSNWNNAYTTTSATFVDINVNDLGLTLTTSGGDVLVWFGVNVNADAAGTDPLYISFNLNLDGSNVTGAANGIARVNCNPNGLANQYEGNMYKYVTGVRLLTSVAAGSHTIKLQWRRVGTGTAEIEAGVTNQFGARELT